jgi:hypothetical protein
MTNLLYGGDRPAAETNQRTHAPQGNRLCTATPQCR